MPRLPRMSGQDAVHVPERLGFHRARQRGSHVIMRRGDRGCAMPLHKELAIGTLRGALRQAGVTPEEFAEASKAG
ncbi:MAG TPA: type II toxin-antitoxin system HicA family toxin [Phycisphaerae bacterium]|nr:type II toxin-antitoxin system HicA family toxin [Phycisphaerae bacterium]